MVSVNISTLDPGLHRLTIETDAAEAGLDPESFRDVRVDVRLDRGEDRVFVAFDASAVARLECDRTLRTFEETIAGSYELLFVEDGEVSSADDPENVRPLNPEDQEVDITEAVRDTLLLAVPQRKVAPGAESIEIPTRFGGSSDDDDIADPRWEALRKLRDSSE